jgi:LDH2 family malate/lactate/ureidoglycolate dehydrogenase
VRPEEARERIAALGFSERDAETLFAHFDDAERRGKRGHGYARIPWLETLPDLDPSARAESEFVAQSHELWDGRGALGYLTLSAVVDAQLERPPQSSRVVVARRCFPTGMLGHYARRLALGGLACLLTATSPPRLSHPDGSPPLAGTNPLTIGIPSSDGRPVVVDVSPAKATWGEVIAGAASERDVVPFGGDQSHKSFAIAVGLQLLVDALTPACGSEPQSPNYAALLVVARPEADPVPALRALAGGVRLPGDR